MEGRAFSIEEASVDAFLLPDDCRSLGTEAFHRAVTVTFQRSYAGIRGQLSVEFAAGRIEVAWEPAAPEPAAPEAPAMASIGPLLQQRRFEEARPLLETLLRVIEAQPHSELAAKAKDLGAASRAGICGLSSPTGCGRTR
jgi:hypothetical protein